jgi:hypothetical protein
MMTGCTLQKRLCALFVQEEEQEQLHGQQLASFGGDLETDTRRCAFIEEILQVRRFKGIHRYSQMN